MKDEARMKRVDVIGEIMVGEGEVSETSKARS